jgi:glutamine synthetase
MNDHNPGIARMEELQGFLQHHPDVEFFDVFYAGMSSVPRGKRLRRCDMPGVYASGRFLPGSLLVTDVTGQDSDWTGLVWEDGDADRLGWPVPGTLTSAPWLGDNIAQVMLSAYEFDGSANGLDPRHVLRRVLDRFAADGLTPIVACELEFYLVDAQRLPDGGLQLPPSRFSGERPTHYDVYSLTELEEISPFLNELWATADVIGVPLEGAISEYSPSQVELTLHHKADALEAADDAVRYKRAAKGVALRHGCRATFMAKPFTDLSGSGMHLHASINDSDGNNVCASDDPHGTPLLRHAIGGMQALMKDGQAIFAPNANSYRRFKANSYAPTASTWGVNNRTVSFRIPAGPPASRHVEHRLAGADANPHLALAVVLAAAHHGITNRLDPGKPVTGNGYAETADADSSTATNWFSALDAFDRSAVLRDYLGDRFVDMFVKVKRQEQARFFEIVPSTDIDWYLLNA